MEEGGEEKTIWRGVWDMEETEVKKLNLKQWHLFIYLYLFPWSIDSSLTTATQL